MKSVVTGTLERWSGWSQPFGRKENQSIICLSVYLGLVSCMFSFAHFSKEFCQIAVKIPLGEIKLSSVPIIHFIRHTLHVSGFYLRQE